MYVVMDQDHHTDTEPYLFTNREAAIEFAKGIAKGSIVHPDGTVAELTEMEGDDIPSGSGRIYYAYWGDSDDAVWVVEKTPDSSM